MEICSVEIKQHTTEKQLGQRRDKRWDQIYREQWEWQYDIKCWGQSKSGNKKEVYIIIGPLHKMRKISNKQLNISP